MNEPVHLRAESATRLFLPEGTSAPIRAVHDVTLEVRRGDIVALIGPSGAGKSTLARLMACMIQPSAGAIWFDGERVDRLRRRAASALRRRLQIVFQEPCLDPRMRAVEQIIEPIAVHFPETTRAAREQRAAELLAEVGLRKSHGASYPFELSLGQCQRVSLARALAVSPDFLIADEPVSALDPSLALQVVDLLETIRERRAMTLMVVCHDLRLACRIGRRIVVMKAGRIVEDAPPGELLSAPSHSCTRALLEASRHV